MKMTHFFLFSKLTYLVTKTILGPQSSFSIDQYTSVCVCASPSINHIFQFSPVRKHHKNFISYSSTFVVQINKMQIFGRTTSICLCNHFFQAIPMFLVVI
uniref:Secreted protein n=1 Tax=Pararge aegeria TaxID=116150 RepID=S4PHA5_9NEOP